MTATALKLYRTTVGKKVVMAVTGLILFGYVVIHMLGNLQIFSGPEKINEYAAFLKSLLPLLWGTRVVLLLAVALHGIAATQLTLLAWDSRPQDYFRKRTLETTDASSTMRWGGPILGLFIVYHVMHYTTGTAHPDFDHANVYGNLIRGFSFWPVSGVYIVAMLALGFHLKHGIWSTLQTLGLNTPRYDGLLRGLSTAVAVVIAVGFVSVPVAVLTGILS